MINKIYAIGAATGTIFNKNKTRGPATNLVILGLLYCSVTRSCRVGDKKRDKYLARVSTLLMATSTTSKVLEQVVGNLGYAAWVEPFGLPLLSFIARHITPDSPNSVIPISHLMRVGFVIWKLILSRNRGIPYKYITNSLPRARTPTFVDASTSIGIGGVHGYDYFSVLHGDLTPLITACPGWESFPQVPIAWIELLAAFVAVSLFGPRYPGHLMVLYSDNTNVVAWLGSSRRSPNPTICTVVAAIERIKYEYLLKLSVRYIPSARNRTADRLSRNPVPSWLRYRGTRRTPPLASLMRLIHVDYLAPSWFNTISTS